MECKTAKALTGGMKKTLLLSLIGMVLSTASYAHVGLKSPTGGEVLAPGSTVTISWEILIEHNTLNWDLYYSVDGGETWITIKEDIPVETLSYDWAVPHVQTSEGRVRIVMDNGEEGTYEDSSENFTIGVLTGVIEPADEQKISLYPNPLTDHGFLDIRDLNGDMYRVTIYNMTGQVVQEIVNINSRRVRIEKSGLSHGLYLLQLSGDGNVLAELKLEVE